MKTISIIGGGCAGYSAAITAARSHINVNLFIGHNPGGQIMLAPTLDNYPGAIVSGGGLIDNMHKQASEWGVNIVNDAIERCDFSNKLLLFDSKNNQIESDAVIITTGKSYNKLGIEKEKFYLGRGLSYCALCDGPLFKNKTVGIVGGGDSAAQAALYLVDFVSKVYIFVRSGQMRAVESYIEQLSNHPKVEIKYHSSIVDIYGDDLMEGVALNTDEKIELTGLFVAIGSNPESHIFKNYITLDEKEYIITDRYGRTNIPHVYAAGDVVSGVYKQAIIAAGDACTSAITALQDFKKKK